MFNAKYLVAVVLVLASSVSFAAQKIAVFDLEAAILNTKAAKKASDKLKTNAKFAEMQAQFEKLRGDMEEMQKEQESKGLTWSTKQAAEHRKNMEYKRADLELAYKKLQAEQASAVRNLMKEMQPKAVQALEALVKKEGIDLVLSAKQAYYVSPKIDLTKKITAKLNKS